MSKAQEIHDKGFNCAQSVFTGLTDITGLSDEEALAISGSFGAGMHVSEVCGTVSGALMALSMIFPYTDPADTASKDKNRTVTQEFHKRFNQEFGTINCVKLIGYNMVEEGYKAEINAKYCPNYIERAVGIVRDIIHEYK